MSLTLCPAQHIVTTWRDQSGDKAAIAPVLALDTGLHDAGHVPGFMRPNGEGVVAVGDIAAFNDPADACDWLKARIVAANVADRQRLQQAKREAREQRQQEREERARQVEAQRQERRRERAEQARQKEASRQERQERREAARIQRQQEERERTRVKQQKEDEKRRRRIAASIQAVRQNPASRMLTRAL